MKIAAKITKIALRTVGWLALAVYVAVALANYSVVQSYLGAAAGRHLSDEWGGTVKIGALHAMPFDHVLLDRVELVEPNGDTVFRCDKLNVRFDGFPFRDGELHFRSVYLKHARFRFATYGNNKNSLSFIIDYFKQRKKGPKKEKKSPGKGFHLEVGQLVLNDVTYRMDLHQKHEWKWDRGVVIPHMEYQSVRGKIRDITVQGEGDVQCRIVRLATTERSGFRVNNISAKVHVGPEGIHAHGLDVTTGNSRIMADADLTWPGGKWKGIGGYVTSVYQQLDLKEGTSVAMSDVAYWAPVLWGNTLRFDAYGTACGTVDSLHTDGMTVHWGETDALLMLSGTMQGLPNIDTASGDISIERLYTRVGELEELIKNFAPRFGGLGALNEAGHIDLQGRATAVWPTTATASLDLGTGWGRAQVDASMRGGCLHAEVESDNLSTTILHTPWLTSAGIQMSIEARVPDPMRIDARTADATVEGRFHRLVVKGHPIDEATLDGRLAEGKAVLNLRSNDTAAAFSLAAAANLSDSLPAYDIALIVDSLRPQAFGLTDDPRLRTLSTSIEAHATGRDLESICGSIDADNTRLADATIGHIGIDVQSHDGNKTIGLASDVADARLEGHFQYAHLGDMARHFCLRYLPQAFTDQIGIAEADTAAVTGQTLHANLRLKDEEGLLRRFVPAVELAKGTYADATYTADGQLKLVARSGNVKIGSVSLGDIGINGRTADSSYRLTVEGSHLVVGGQQLMSAPTVELTTHPSRLLASLVWGNDSEPSDGDLMLALDGNEVSVVKPYFRTGNHHWRLGLEQAQIDLHSASVSGLSVGDGNQRAAVSANLSGNERDYVQLDFDRFHIGTLADLLLQNSGLTLRGDIGGRFTLYGIGSTPYFNANLTVDSCAVGEQTLGTLALRSTWNAELNILNLLIDNPSLNAHGWIGLGGEKKDLNLSVGFNHFDLALVAPVMASFAKRFDGSLHGSIDVGGTLDKPLVVGEAYVDDGLLEVEANGVAYRFADTLRFDNHRVRFDDFHVSDPAGNIAHIDGKVLYPTLNDISLDLHLQTDNLTVFDKPRGESFYGRVMAQAEGNVGGTLDDLRVELRARTNEGTAITVPVSDRRQVHSQNYITFYNPDADSPTHSTETHSQSTGKTKGKIGVSIAADISVTPDAQLTIPMSFSEVSVTVATSGSGDVHANLATGQNAQVMGSYELSSGTMKLMLLSLITKNFTIEPGSSLNFQGDPSDARFDISAAYSQRVNLSTLTGNLSSIDNTQKYLQVEDIINVSGTLANPSIGFDLRLPGADQSVEEEVFAYIDRTSERDMLNQTMSLLVSGKFYNVSGTTQATSSATSGGVGSIASTLGNLMADMVEFVDINVDYKAATDLTNEQLDLNISKDWGRWNIESTLGYGGESRNLEANASTTPVIDAVVSYRVSPLLYLFVYNRTNTNDYTRIDLPYKQGVGLRLSKDFDSWGDLFRRSKTNTTHP